MNAKFLAAVATVLVAAPASAQSYGFGEAIGPGTYEDPGCREGNCRFTLMKTGEGEPLALQYDSGSCGVKGRMDKAADVAELDGLKARGALGGTIYETNFTPMRGTFDVYLVKTKSGDRFVVRMSGGCPTQYTGQFVKKSE